MFFISHRGNIHGPDPKKENKIDYINDAISKNFDVEIDLWFEKENFYLGHDSPENKVDMKFLKNKKLWIHCKNLESFYELSKYDLNFFWHEEDKITITSKGYFWNFPGTMLSKKSICVMPEKSSQNNFDCLGICSDYIKKYYDRYNNI